jgi:energy-coupling factor transport system substrate-specific component
MENTNKWMVKDVITTALMSVLLIVIQPIVNMVCMVNDFVSMVLSVGFTMLLCAPVYFLMVNRVHKRFVSLVYMTLLGVIFLLMGNWFLLPYFMVVGFICEGIPPVLSILANFKNRKDR